MKILRPLPDAPTPTKPAWKKPAVEYPKDATIVEIPYQWPDQKTKPKKKADTKPKPRLKPKKKRTLYCWGNERNEWTEEEVDTLIRMYNEGRPYIEIAEATRHGENSIGYKLLKLRKEGRVKEVRNPVGWTREQDELLVRMREHGVTFGEIGKAVGKSTAATWSRYRKIMGVKE